MTSAKAAELTAKIVKLTAEMTSAKAAEITTEIVELASTEIVELTTEMTSAKAAELTAELTSAEAAELTAKIAERIAKMTRVKAAEITAEMTAEMTTGMTAEMTTEIAVETAEIAVKKTTAIGGGKYDSDHEEIYYNSSDENENNLSREIKTLVPDQISDRIVISDWSQYSEFPDGDLKYRLPMVSNKYGNYKTASTCGWVCLQDNYKMRKSTSEVVKTGKCAGTIVCSNQRCTTGTMKPRSSKNLISKQLQSPYTVCGSRLLQVSCSIRMR